MLEKLSNKINSAGISQRELSIKTGIPNSSLSAWLRGSRKPKAKSIKALASALNCEVSDISDYKDIDFKNRDGHRQQITKPEILKEAARFIIDIESKYQLLPGDYKALLSALGAVAGIEKTEERKCAL